VTFFAPAWNVDHEDATFMALAHGCKGTGYCSVNFVLATNPLIETGCEAGPAPADADAFARSVRSNPHLEATAPVAVSVGGIDALRMDVIAAPGGAVCDGPLVLARGVGLLPTDRMRLYLLDVPGGSARMLAIAVIARDPYAKVQVAQPTFEQVVEEATPIVESIEFHTA
jgi:hypothetical protein